MSAPRVESGWVVVGIDGHAETSRFEMVLGTERKPAFLDFSQGRRVAKVRPPAGVTGRLAVQLVVDGVVAVSTIVML